MPLQGGFKENFLSRKAIAFFCFLILTVGIYSPIRSIGEFGAAATFRPGIRRVESGIVSYKTKKFYVVESENFILKYEDVDLEILDLILKTSEDKYEKLIEIFDYKFDEKIQLIVYNDVNTMMQTTMLRGERAPMGVYFGNSIHLYNPIYWIDASEDLEWVFNNEGPVLHELVHKFTDHIARGNFPTWFTEGVSLYFEYRVDKYEWGRDLEVDLELYSIENLTNRFYSLDANYSYTQSFRLVREFVEHNGEEALLALIEDLGRGRKLDSTKFIF